jgi:hypothetical protein
MEAEILRSEKEMWNSIKLKLIVSEERGVSFISLSAVAQRARPERTAACARYIQKAPFSFSIYPCVSFPTLPLLFLSNSLNYTSSNGEYIYIPKLILKSWGDLGQPIHKMYFGGH